MEELPAGHDLTVSLYEASRRCRIKIDDLRERLAMTTWARLGFNIWGSLTPTRLVTLRQFDELDSQDHPIAIKGTRS